MKPGIFRSRKDRRRRQVIVSDSGAIEIYMMSPVRDSDSVRYQIKRRMDEVRRDIETMLRNSR